jgi:hydrogenase maturation factor
MDVIKTEKVIFAVVVLFCFSALGNANAEAANSDIVRLGVMPFVSKADDVSDRQARIITDVFTQALANSKTIAVLELEELIRDLSFGFRPIDPITPPEIVYEIGRTAGCQYILLGSVTPLLMEEGGGRIPNGGNLRLPPRDINQKNRVANATLDLRIIDMTSTNIVLALSESGNSSESPTGIGIRGDWYREGEFGELEARAIDAVVLRLAHKIREELGGEYSYVLFSEGKKVQIDLGAMSGIKVGDFYLIYADGREFLDVDGNLIGREKHNIALVKVAEVQNSYSVCDVVPKGGDSALIHHGQKIEPISREAGQNLIKRGDFAKVLPRSSGTFEEIFLPNDSAPSRPAPRSDRPQENKSTDPGKVVMTYPLAPGEMESVVEAMIFSIKILAVQ